MAQKKIAKTNRISPNNKYILWMEKHDIKRASTHSKQILQKVIITVIIVPIIIIPIIVRFHNIRVAGLENIRGAVCWKTKELLCVGADQDQPSSQPARQD